jgi:hypothetical protein
MIEQISRFHRLARPLGRIGPPDGENRTRPLTAKRIQAPLALPDMIQRFLADLIEPHFGDQPNCLAKPLAIV